MEKKEATIKDYIQNSNLAIEKLIDDYYGYITIIVKNAKAISITDEDVEEIVSDTFLVIWKSYQTLDKTIKIKPYLAGIAKNLLRNKYRTTTMNYDISDYEEKLASLFSLDEITEEKEQNQELKNALKDLKQEEYQIFIAFYYEEKKIKEIAKELEISESNVKVILHRVRKKLKKKIKDWRV